LARTDLKLIIASATINAQKFSDFFNKAPILNIPGRRFPVDIHYTKNPEANYIQAAMTTIFQIHLTQKLPGDILVFLSGQEEIENMETALNESIAKLGSEIQPMIICSIYANLPTELQAKIFEPTPANSRKVVLATNIAETSITIDGIAYVIDPGYVKQNVYNPTTGMESLVVVPCSRASADQRAGRAGRIGPGKCFRLYTKWSFYNELELNPTPEILRVNLVGVILLLLSLGINDLVNFDFMDRPSTETIGKSLELLYALGALNHQGMLTKTGKKMAEFPIDPMFCKCLLVSEKFGVFHSVLSIITMLSEGGNLFYRPKDKREQADKQKEKFIHELGDHFLLLRVWNEWVDSGYSNQWCEDNFIQYKSMKRIRDIRKQLLGLSTRIGIDVNKEDDNDNELTIQKALVSGFFPHVVKLSKMGDSYHKLKLSQPVFIHPSSSIYSTKPPPKLVLYHELVLTSKEFMRNCMIIQDESTVANYGGHYYSKTDLQSITKR
jgi:HrpA-like RNA helicase